MSKKNRKTAKTRPSPERGPQRITIDSRKFKAEFGNWTYDDERTPPAIVEWDERTRKLGRVVAEIHINPDIDCDQNTVGHLLAKAPILWRMLRDAVPHLDVMGADDTGWIEWVAKCVAVLTETAGRNPYEMRQKHCDEGLYASWMRGAGYVISDDAAAAADRLEMAQAEYRASKKGR